MYSYEEILSRMLARVSDELDKRQGSVIYDALAPAAAELAELYIELTIYMEQTFLTTATGTNLDNRGADYGMLRDEASASIRLGIMKNNNDELIDIPIGSRFSVPEANITYEAIEKIDVGNYKLQCEQLGTIGDEYSGNLLPIYLVPNLTSATISTIIVPGQDTETDSSFRERIINRINQRPFAGNKSSYLEYVNDIEGVGGCKVFPVWNGGGTVKVSVIDSNFDIPTNEFINEIQEELDPTQDGTGIGTAPIGHIVTVVAPSEQEINVEATLNLAPDITIDQIETLVAEAINEYIYEIKESWANSTDTLIIYRSRMIAAILTVDGIENVSGLTINSSENDLVLQENATTQQLPDLGGVVLYAN